MPNIATERRAVIESAGEYQSVVFYRVYSIAHLSSVGPSHYVVHFIDGDCIACVLKKVIVTPPEPIVGDACCMQWSDGVEYAATVLAMGK